ncbi:MAG: putative toxin-antitoxin system toxin component, PIN family [bacterium]
MVVDTSVLISGFVFGGVPEKVVRKVFESADIYVSPQLLKEYRDTPVELEIESKITLTQLRALLSGIAAFISNAEVVSPEKALYLCRDEKDNMVIECCVAANADFLVTSDKDLLEIDKKELKRVAPKLKIISPAVFLKIKN